LKTLWLQRPVWVTGITVASCALAATQLPKVYFDYNLLHMQSHGLPAVVFEQNSSIRPQVRLFGAVIATNLQHAVYLEQQLTNLPAVSGLSLSPAFHRGPAPKLAVVGEIKRSLASIHFAPPDTSPVNIPELSRTLYSLGGYLGLALGEVGKDEPDMAKQFALLRQHIDELRKKCSVAIRSRLRPMRRNWPLSKGFA